MYRGNHLSKPLLPSLRREVMPAFERILTLDQKTLKVYPRVSIFITSSSLDHFEICLCAYY